MARKIFWLKLRDVDIGISSGDKCTGGKKHIWTWSDVLSIALIIKAVADYIGDDLLI